MYPIDCSCPLIAEYYLDFCCFLAKGQKRSIVKDCVLFNIDRYFPAVCTVPTMQFVASTSPESRVAEGGNVEVTCSDGSSYGNAGSQTIVCSSSTNNFPASCRRE